MNSRIHPKYRTRYRVTHWAEYDKSLMQRGNITVLDLAGSHQGLDGKTTA